MKVQFLTALLISASIPAFAVPAGTDPGRAPNIDFAKLCPNLSLTQAQVDSLHASIAQGQVDEAAQKTTLDAAKKDYFAALADPAIPQVEVAKRELVVKTDLDTMINSAFAKTEDLVFNILTPAQRPEGVACLQTYMKSVEQAKTDSKAKQCPQERSGQE
jgi:Spy/CpxP family protein refolding chaperone